MKERMRDIWELVREKEALDAAGRALCERANRVLRLKLSISAACGLIVALTPIAAAAHGLTCLV